MPTEFYFEIQYFHFDWKNHNHTSSLSQKHSTVTSMYDVTATVGKTPPYWALQNLKICRRKEVILCTPLQRGNEFYWIFKISWNSRISRNCKRPGTELSIYGLSWVGHCRTEHEGLDIDGVDNDGRIWPIDCNLLKITIQRFYQLTGTHNSFESVLSLKTSEIHIDQQKLRTYNKY